ncbi:PIR protein [Plasmodium yoelii]|uniref:PIR protein n=2 Tax=Plasmodium yoelii TaxID=5861 RepID=A0AAF0AZT0_PLAYO|nr:PIR protein [Plasmodium yoelii]WBY54643.1 PIR protein [Plasmodium yoelii yoelii]CDS44170.1 YIR protein [Plasmodium yoelii]VTZ71636.1 PIR protein [Plasmodium yoelii]|eukprot:XP_034493344.1 PIR protein [Plasmodium yoelii]
MNKQVCESFMSVWENFPDTLTNDKKYQFKDQTFLTSYCVDNECKADLEKMNAVFFHLVSKFFGSSGLFNNNVKDNINAVEYIIIWLSHMLNLKDNEGNILTNFYKVYINNQEKYKNPIYGVDDCSNYNELIYKKNKLMNITNEKLSKFYAPFKLLCEMYTEFDENTSNCKKCSEKANEFAKKYNELNGDSSITKDSSCNKLLCTLSNDYDNFKKKCKNCSSFPAINKPNITPKCPEKTSEQSLRNSAVISEDAPSSSSITSKLFTVLSIFGAIAFFLGISYKYSLFGFRKRFQKQKLREKIKKIKKKMNH